MRSLLPALCAMVLCLAGCHGATSFECDGVPLVLEEVETGRELRHPMGGSDQARPGYELVRVSLEPPQGERNPARCGLALMDDRANRFEPVTSWWQLTGPGVLVWVFEVPETATGLRLVLPDGMSVDIGL